jgi:hypothetical protein
MEEYFIPFLIGIVICAALVLITFIIIGLNYTLPYTPKKYWCFLILFPVLIIYRLYQLNRFILINEEEDPVIDMEHIKIEV